MPTEATPRPANVFDLEPRAPLRRSPAPRSCWAAMLPRCPLPNDLDGVRLHLVDVQTEAILKSFGDREGARDPDAS